MNMLIKCRVNSTPSILVKIKQKQSEFVSVKINIEIILWFSNIEGRYSIVVFYLSKSISSN